MWRKSWPVRKFRVPGWLSAPGLGPQHQAAQHDAGLRGACSTRFPGSLHSECCGDPAGGLSHVLYTRRSCFPVSAWARVGP